MDASEADGSRLNSQDNESVMVEFQIDEDASEGDSCQLTLMAWDEISKNPHITSFMRLSLEPRTGLNSLMQSRPFLTPGRHPTGPATIRNTGTEPTHLRISGSANGLSIITPIQILLKSCPVTLLS